MMAMLIVYGLDMQELLNVASDADDDFCFVQPEREGGAGERPGRLLQQG